MSLLEPNSIGSNSIYDVNDEYNYPAYKSSVDAAFNLQPTTVQSGFVSSHQRNFGQGYSSQNFGQGIDDQYNQNSSSNLSFANKKTYSHIGRSSYYESAKNINYYEQKYSNGYGYDPNNQHDYNCYDSPVDHSQASLQPVHGQFSQGHWQGCNSNYEYMSTFDSADQNRCYESAEILGYYDGQRNHSKSNNGHYVDGTWLGHITGYVVNSQPEVLSNQQNGCRNILESIQRNIANVHESFQRTQEMNENFQRRKEKLEEDWRKQELEHMKKRREYEEVYRARLHTYLTSKISHSHHPLIQSGKEMFNSVIEDKVGLETSQLAEPKSEPKICHSSVLKEIDHRLSEYEDQFGEGVEHLDMIVGDKANQRKPQLAELKVKTEVGYSSSDLKHETLAYIVSEFQEHAIRLVNEMHHGFHVLETKAGGTKFSNFSIKHRWPPPL